MLRIPLNEQGLGLFTRMTKAFAASAVGGKAIGFFVLILSLLFAVNGLNIVNSYVGRDFMTAIAERNVSAYFFQALLYLAVFAGSTAVAVFLRYAEERLGLLWRAWMTQHLLGLYLQYPTYYRINDALIKKSGMENPDQRIADDVRAFTTSTLSFTLMSLNGVFTVVAFSGVLWSISPELFGVAVAYAAGGSYLAVRLGRPLIDLNYAQLDKEAKFRSGLIHVGQKAESLALLHGEKPMLNRLSHGFEDVTDNFQKIITVHRNLSFFTTGYNYLLQIIPALLVAPLFIRGDVEFGVITQSTMAFTMLIGAFSLIVTQFQSISSYAAVIERLINLWYAIELVQSKTVSGMEVIEGEGLLELEGVTLRSTTDGRVLVQDLSVSIQRGTRVLVTVPSETVKDAVLRVIAGILDTATGTIKRPPQGQILFLPERPYLAPGSLRDALSPGDGDVPAVTDDKLVELLGSIGLDGVIAQVGGLDAERDWDSTLSVGEQQLVSFARILLRQPQFVVLDRPSAEMYPEQAAQLLAMLTEQGITYITLEKDGRGGNGDASRLYDAVLSVKPGGSWEWRRLAGKV